MRKSRNIAIYLAADGELDPMPLVFAPPTGRRSWHLPVLHPHRPGRLWFVRWRPGDPLRPNRFGIPEPVLRKGRIRHARQLDLVLLPLVGFDDRCHRIGMGGGFYDRSLAFLGDPGHPRRPRLIGLAHACQHVASIPPRRWDIPLDAVVTETRVYHRRSPTLVHEGDAA